jgi:hypothetical protein
MIFFSPSGFNSTYRGHVNGLLFFHHVEVLKVTFLINLFLRLFWLSSIFILS